MMEARIILAQMFRYFRFEVRQQLMKEPRVFIPNCLLLADCWRGARTSWHCSQAEERPDGARRGTQPITSRARTAVSNSHI